MNITIREESQRSGKNMHRSEDGVSFQHRLAVNFRFETLKRRSAHSFSNIDGHCRRSIYCYCFRLYSSFKEQNSTWLLPIRLKWSGDIMLWNFRWEHPFTFAELSEIFLIGVESFLSLEASLSRGWTPVSLEAWWFLCFIQKALCIRTAHSD